MWVHNLDPVILEIFGFEIRYYGLVYVFGFLLTWWLLHKYRERLSLSKQEVEDCVFYIILGVLIGSRLFEVIFWNPGYYLSNPLKVFYIWEGGMAFHGGVIGIIFGLLYFVRKFKNSFWKLADVLVLSGTFALALGRIANFINGELWGTVTEVSWCVVFPNVTGCRHPVTLYGAIGRFVLFGWCLWLWKKGMKAGFVFWNFVFFIGLGRLLVDVFRENARYFYLSLGQWYSLVMIIVGGWFLWNYYSNDIKKLVKSVN